MSSDKKEDAIPNFKRALVFGNGGSGKTWLASRLSSALKTPLVNLDDLHWEPGRYGVARDKQVVAELVRVAAAQDNWIMEGVYGWLAAIALPRTTTLIWLDIGEAECIQNIKQRGIQGGEDEEAFQGMLKWVAEYRLRTNSNSYGAHAQLFSRFSDAKFQLTSREAIAAFVPARKAKVLGGELVRNSPINL